MLLFVRPLKHKIYVLFISLTEHHGMDIIKKLSINTPETWNFLTTFRGSLPYRISKQSETLLTMTCINIHMCVCVLT